MPKVYPTTSMEVTVIETDTNQGIACKNTNDKVFAIELDTLSNLPSKTTVRERMPNMTSLKRNKVDILSPSNNNETNHDDTGKQHYSRYQNEDANGKNVMYGEESENMEPSLETEKSMHERKYLARNEKLKALIMDQDVKPEWGNFVLHIFLIIRFG